MELRRTKLIQELREAREELLNINFAADITSLYKVAAEIASVYNRTLDRDSLIPVGDTNISNPYGLVLDWFNKWRSTFNRFDGLISGAVSIKTLIEIDIYGYDQVTDVEIFNELRPGLVSHIDYGLHMLDQEYQVKPLLEEYTKRVKDTKLSVLLNEFNAAKDTTPNLAAIGFRTILSLVIQEKAKREKPQSDTATKTDLALDKMISSAKTDGILSGDVERLLNSFKATHKDIYDFVAHRPGADKLVDKSEVDTMVDLLNKLLPSIIN